MPSKRGSRGGARVTRGRKATPEPPSIHEIYLAVQDAMSEAAQTRILEWWARTNPYRRGAHVADILDLLYESDSYLNLSEPFWERHGERLAGELGEHWQTVGVSAVAAVILMGLTGIGSGQWPVQEPISIQPPDDYCRLACELAKAAAAGQRGVIAAPAGLVEWLEEDGSLAVRHPDEEQMLLELTGTCDDCIHPRGDHDRTTGACWRTNPSVGPCPCRHTSDEIRAAQQRIFDQRHRHS